MFRSFALTLALALSAVSVLFLVIGKAASKGEAILPALPGLAGEETGDGKPPTPGPRLRIHTVAVGESLSSIARRHYGDAKAWKPVAEANGLQPPYVLQAGQKLALPGLGEEGYRPTAVGSRSEHSRRQPRADSRELLPGFSPGLILRILGMYLLGVVVFGGIILDQSARVLEVRRRSLGRAFVAMALASVAFLSALVMAGGLALELDDLLGRSWAIVIGYGVGAGGISILSVLAVMKYTFHTTTGKAMFLLVSYRFALAFALVTTALSAWLVLSGRLANGIESVARLIQA